MSTLFLNFVENFSTIVYDRFVESIYYDYRRKNSAPQNRVRNVTNAILDIYETLSPVQRGQLRAMADILKASEKVKKY